MAKFHGEHQESEEAQPAERDAGAIRNKGVRSELKTRVKAAQDAVAQGAEDADERLRLAQKRLGKAASKGVIHKNAAARRQSRLMRRRAADAPPDRGPRAAQRRAGAGRASPVSAGG